jgi:hypothetical protein
VDPFWKVISVFDPAGTGSDFAYTVGLADRGCPELHVWSRPTDGDDPGADFTLSSRDAGGLLNRWAGELLAGALVPGDTREVPLDAGATRAIFTAAEPGDPDTLDAFGVAPGAQVIGMRWVLERVPIGPRTVLSASERARICAQTLTLADQLDVPGVRGTWTGRRPVTATDISVDPAQLYGPRTTLVLTRAAWLADADVDGLADLLNAALESEEALSVKHVLALTGAAARPVGLVDALAAAQDLVDEVTAAIQGPGLHGRRWRGLLVELGVPMSGEEVEQVSGAVADLLRSTVAAILGVDVLGDDGDERTRATVEAWLRH